MSGSRAGSRFDSAVFLPGAFVINIISLYVTKAYGAIVKVWSSVHVNPARVCVCPCVGARVWVALGGRLFFDTLLAATPPLNTPTACHASCSCCASMQKM